MPMARTAEVERGTNETRVKVSVDLDPAAAVQAGASGEAVIGTRHGFLDHLLDQLRRHGRLGLAVTGQGDLHVDVHHLAEDVGITLGQAVSRALGDRGGIERYADAYVPMDETLAHVVLDLSGRPYLSFSAAGFQGEPGGFNAFHLRELLRGFANHAGATLHVRILSGEETHHVCEAVMKAFARSLHLATRVTRDDLPSTKGVI